MGAAPASRREERPDGFRYRREWRILTALEGTPVPHPRPLLFCDDRAVIGAPFLVMELVDGFTPGFALPEPFASDQMLRRELAMAYVDGCAALSQVDWQARGLDGLGKPEGFLERQVPRWLAQLDRYRTRELPELDFVTAWLEANTPPMSPAAIIHGDYSPFNVMVAPAPPTRLAAIVDWDTGTIGDPLLDIGHLLARWTEPGEEPVIDVQAGGVDGYPTRAEMAARYADRTGRDLGALAFYEVLALFKLAVILEGTHAAKRPPVCRQLISRWSTSCPGSYAVPRNSRAVNADDAEPAMNVGIYFDLRNPPQWRQDPHRLYGFTLEMCEEAERLGANSVWFSEHHLFEDGYLPQPLTFAAAVAARTSRVRIGTAVLLAPLRPAVQIAEDVAIVDILSDGRMELGLGAGYRVPEFELFGADIERRYAATDRACPGAAVPLGRGPDHAVARAGSSSHLARLPGSPRCGSRRSPR